MKSCYTSAYWINPLLPLLVLWADTHSEMQEEQLVYKPALSLDTLI
jgi:hypothetical protein